MKTLIVVVSALVLASSPIAAARQVPPGAKQMMDALSADYADRMQQAIRERIARADERFASALQRKADGDAPRVALVSLATRKSVAEIRSALARCACEIQQLQRTIGETQMAFNMSPALLQDQAFMSGLREDFMRHLEAGITDMDAEARGASADEMRWISQRRSAYSRALAETRISGLRFNGFVVAASLDSLGTMRGALGSDVLAIELLAGSARPYVIPLETYR